MIIDVEGGHLVGMQGIPSAMRAGHACKHAYQAAPPPQVEKLCPSS